MSKDYNDLIEENIDELNSSSDFAGTDLSDEEKLKPKSDSFFSSLWFYLIAICLAGNLILYFYYQNTSPDIGMTMQEANEQVKEVFGATLNQLESLIEE